MHMNMNSIHVTVYLAKKPGDANFGRSKINYARSRDRQAAESNMMK